MPKVKVPTDEFDAAALDEVEYNEEDRGYDNYEGELPEENTVLIGYVKSMWWTWTKNDDRMFKIIFIAADNEDEEEEFNGLPIWDNPFFSAEFPFRYKPFLANFDLTAKDVQTKLYTDGDEHERFGLPVTKVGTLVPGGDTSWCRVLTGIGFDQAGNRRAEVKKWLPYEEVDEEPEAEVEEPEKAEEEEPEIFEDEDGNLVNAEGEFVDEEGNVLVEEEEQEEEPEPAPVRRARRPAPAAAEAATPTRAQRGRSAGSSAATSKPAAKTAPARGGRAAAPAQSRKPAAAKASSKPAPRGRRAKSSGDEPPF